MSRYDGLIIPRSYSEYINKTDAATLQQALQLSGVLSGAVAAGDNKAVKSRAVATALAGKQDTLTFDNTPTSKSNNPVKSSGIFAAIEALKKKTLGRMEIGGSIDITVPQYKVMLLHTKPYNNGALVIIAVSMFTDVMYNVLINQNNSFSVTSIGYNTLRITNNNPEYTFDVDGITF